ncbi:unnamed protein product [Chondrus crispus]|uniref:PDZ domain-containing protein n=1 Tax=Chondrus crispus TaxID=2769 RepID=R7QJ32_CHOCR|nr:unnamed protein product [Chondrus crispus]CDF37425.1 unnamed protein product [Chondrus crispus]|eukprot:XP_005717244.1 unnamed protein product [Chondrus crispus]
MVAFANALGSSALFTPASLTASSSFCGCTVSHRRAPTARLSRRSFLPGRIVCEEGFNYNIYQDGKDRAKRMVDSSDRSVTVQKPLGLVLEEGQDGMVFVAEMDPEGNAADSGEINEGDILVAVSATFGEEVWSTRGVGLDRVMKSIRIRAGDFVTLVVESPETLSERKSMAAVQAENRRTEARDKFGEREVLDPVTWRSNAPKETQATYEYGDPAQAQIDEQLKEKLKAEISAPYEQNWILWVGAGVLVLVVLSVAFGITG